MPQEKDKQGPSASGEPNAVFSSTMPLEGDLRNVTRSGPGSDCLVVIYSHTPASLGKRFALLGETLTVGRAPDNGIVLDNNPVSRYHARFEKRAGVWFIVDLKSRNGTSVNGQKISEERLRPADQVQVGDTVFKFLSGSNVESAFLDEVHQLMSFDGLTQAHNRRYFMAQLQTEVARARSQRTPLSMGLFLLEDSKKIRDTFGPSAGDKVLQEIVTLTRPRIRSGETLARYGTDEFGVLLPGVGLEEARGRMDELCVALSSNVFMVRNERIPVVVPACVAQLDDGSLGGEAFLERTEAVFLAGRRDMRGRVIVVPPVTYAGSGEATAVQTFRPVLDGPWMLQRLLSRNAPGAILAFELDNEPEVIQHLGSGVRDEWLRELVRTAENETSAADFVATWRERFVFLGLVDAEPSAVQKLRERVIQRWSALPISQSSARVVPHEIARALRCATLEATELQEHGKRSLDVVVARLIKSSEPQPRQSDIELDLPFPMAALRAKVATHRLAFARLKVELDAIEATLKFLVAAELASLRAGAEPAVLKQASPWISRHIGRMLSMGTWEDLAWRLASLLPDNSSDPVASAARMLVRGKSRSPLAESVQAMVSIRNRIAHGAILSDDAYTDDVDRCKVVLDGLTAALQPLARLRMVSVAEIENIGDEEELIGYSLYLHRGPMETFPIVQESLAAKLSKDWCYLIGDAQFKPLLLAPVVVARTCEECKRLEVYLSDDLCLGPRGAKMRGRGVTTGHSYSAEIPWSRSAGAMYDLISADGQ